jgi:nucleotide-binding universal stress UspA family protein
LAWAVGTARRYGMPLLLVAAYRPPTSGGPYGPVIAAVEDDVRAVVDEAFREVCGGRPEDLRVDVAYVMSSAGPALVAAAGAGDLLVIGSSGRRWGPTRRYCARRARCPLVIVPCPDAGDLIGQPVRTARRLARQPRHD